MFTDLRQTLPGVTFGASIALALMAALLVGSIVSGAANTVTTVDATGDVGKYTSMVLDAGGKPNVAYYDATNGDLKVLHCGNTSCTEGNSIVAPDTAGDVGRYPSIALDATGYPVVAYYDVTNGNLKVLRCGNENCSVGNTITNADTAANVGVANSLQLDAAGNPVVAHYDVGNGDLRVVHCGDATCSMSTSITTPATAGDVGDYPSLQIDALGNPLISYFDKTNGDLMVVHCNDPLCAGGDESFSSPDQFGVVGAYTSLELDVNGIPVISYWDLGNLDVKLARCGNEDCSGITSVVSLDVTSDVGPFTSLELDGAGNPVISYWDSTSSDLKVIHCAVPDCTESDPKIVVGDAQGDVGLYTNLALGTDGTHFVSYYDSGSGDLKVLSCPGCDLDSDDDGCSDALENGPDVALGGQRDYENPWDFYDVAGANHGPPDRIIDLFNDVVGVVDHYAPTGMEAEYDVAYDRGPSAGPDLWNMTAPDGKIDLFNDISGVINQYGHSCR